MCGFAGFARSPDGPPPDPELLAAMGAELEHRGPDDDGLHVEDEVGLAFRRLSIIDLGGGHQPMSNEDGSVVVVFNGEIYNFERLRAELEDHAHRWTTRTDTEVLVHGYETWGIEGLLGRLNGMFAFALWDRSTRTLHLARDRIGIKPLYFGQTNEGLAFASEIGSLRHLPWLRSRLDDEALRYFLAVSYIPAPMTIFPGIRKLLPGYRLEFRNGNLEARAYWKVPDPAVGEEQVDAEDRAEELLMLLRDSVRMRMVSDVPVGLFLSAGLDSSAICSLYTDFGPAGTSTFTVGFAEEGYSEVAGARAVAKRYGLQNFEAIVPAPDEPFLRRLVRAYGEPFGDSSAVNILHLAELARRRVTVALSGDGGDEILGGYQTYPASLAAQRYGRVPAPLRAALLGVVRGLVRPGLGKVGPGLKARLFLERADRDLVRAHFAWRRIYGPRDLEGILESGRRDREFEDRYDRRLRNLVPRRDDLDPLNLLMYLDVRAYLADDMLVKVDRATMAHSLEARVPFLDHRLVEWAMHIPGRLKVRSGVTKKILRDALRGRVPERVRTMPKAGFNAPLPHWFLGGCGDLLARILADGALASVGIDLPAARRLLAEHRGRRADHGHRLWSLLVLGLWLDEVLPEWAR